MTLNDMRLQILFKSLALTICGFLTEMLSLIIRSCPDCWGSVHNSETHLAAVQGFKISVCGLCNKQGKNLSLT